MEETSKDLGATFNFVETEYCLNNVEQKTHKTYLDKWNLEVIMMTNDFYFSKGPH